MNETNEFKIVSRKKKKFGKQNIAERNPEARNNNSLSEITNYKKRINICIQDLNLSLFFKASFGKPLDKSDPKPRLAQDVGTALKFLSLEDVSVTEEKQVSTALQTPSQVHLLCYGLGNFTTCLIARYQLAFLLCLKEKLGATCTMCSVYDPVFTEEEKDILKYYQCEVIMHNEEAKRECLVPTVAFLPHCGKAMYNNLLWKNLVARENTLHNLILIGNSFSHMVERSPLNNLKETGNYILLLQPYTREVKLPETFQHTDVFNDTAIHIFSTPESFGQNDVFQEPFYQSDDVELCKIKGI
ncbi:SRR1-like protein isoform X2 [Physella acuta]|uniref:SRR1-like protein isoform X2 n=1 Tax=Physella acuta TaxID=109671 RepID=UPI0027DDEAE8|nr:SRR1-like protein isoform X2 [Physella acuta]